MLRRMGMRRMSMISPEPRTTLCAILRSRNARQHVTRATFYGNLQENAAAQNLGPHFNCASLRSRNACQHFTRATLYVKVAGKMPCPNLSPERGQSLCASLRGRNAYQHFARATLYRNLQEKCRGPEPRTTLCASRNRNALGDFTRATGKCRGPAGAPWSSTGLYSYRKNPSVWTHSLAKYT